MAAATPPPSRPSRISPLGWVLRGLGLIAVSVASGLIWLAFNPGDEQAEQSQQQERRMKYDFQLYGRDEAFQRCDGASTGKIKEFLSEHRCEHLTRALYTTTLGDGERILTSVVAVRMPDEATARQLNERVTADHTGNIKDLVSDGLDVPDDFPELEHDYGYASQQQRNLVVVGESAYFSDPESEDDRLTGVTTDALKLARKQDDN